MRRLKIIILAIVFLMFSAVGKDAFAASYTADIDYKNSDTGFRTIIIDQADYLTSDEEEKLFHVMDDGTKYGNMVLLTLSENENESKDACIEAYKEFFDESENGVVFLIDGANEYLYLTHFGAISYWLEEGTSQSICEKGAAAYGTDYDCAETVFTEVCEHLKQADVDNTNAATEDELTKEEAADSAESEDDAKKGNELRGTNPDSNYETRIIDNADLLTDGEEKSLLEEMNELAYYGNVVFYSTEKNNKTPSARAEAAYSDIYGGNTVSGTLLLVDMQNRELYLYNAGSASKDMSYVITSSKSSSIMDNVYKYASKKDYYKCASETYRQELRVMGGGKIAQPMRLVSNIFLALVFAFLIAYFVVMTNSQTMPPSEKELLAAIQLRQALNNYNKVFTHQTRKYDPPSSSSSGGGGGGGGGGHSSGGGHGF